MLIIHACVPQNKTNGLKDRRTYVDYLDSIIQIEEMHLGASKDTFINLKNAGNEPLIIYNIESSCGCTVASWEKQPISPNKETKIRLKIRRFEIGYFNKNIKITCNSKQSPILFRIQGTVI